MDVFRSPGGPEDHDRLRQVQVSDLLRSRRVHGEGLPKTVPPPQAGALGSPRGQPALHGGTRYPGHRPTAHRLRSSWLRVPHPSPAMEGGAAGTGHTVPGAQGVLPASPQTAASVKG